MLRKTAAGLLILTATLAGAAAVHSSFTAQDKELADLEKSKERGSLRWYAKLAKAKGQTRIERPGLLVEYVTDVKSMERMLKVYDLVVAQPFEKRTAVGRHDRIFTYFKFKILENVSGGDLGGCDGCPPPSFVPEEMLPLAHDEILVGERGGTVTVDDVDVVVEPEYGFDMSRQYLLFLEVEESGTLGRIMVGPDAVFTVNPDESLTPLTHKPHSLKHLIKKQYKDSLKELRKARKV